MNEGVDHIIGQVTLFPSVLSVFFIRYPFFCQSLSMRVSTIGTLSARIYAQNRAKSEQNYVVRQI